MMVHADRRESALQSLVADDFDSGLHRGLFLVLRTRHRAGLSCQDTKAVLADLASCATLTDLVDLQGHLQDCSLDSDFDVALGEVIRGGENRREQVKVAKLLAALQGDEPEERIDELRRELLKPSGRTESLESVQIRAFMDESIDRIKARADGREKPLVTPWDAVNKCLPGGGIWPGLVVLTGNTGSGKTQLALQLVLHAATAKHPTLYVGLELDRLGLVCRLATMAYRETHKESCQKWSCLWAGKEKGLAAVFGETRETIEALPLYLDQSQPGGWSMVNAERRLVELTAGRTYEDPCPLVVVDFLQLVGGREKELRERIGAASYSARILAREHNAVVVLISSTARENYLMLAGKHRKKDGKESDLDNIRPESLVGLGKESGEIEYSADLVLAMVRKENGVDLAIAKQRAGVAAMVPLQFDGCMFTDRGGSNGTAKPRDV